VSDSPKRKRERKGERELSLSAERDSLNLSQGKLAEYLSNLGKNSLPNNFFTNVLLKVSSNISRLKFNNV
jgi:hypothetical protein